MHQNFQPKTFIFFTFVIYLVSLTAVFARVYPPTLSLTSDLSTLAEGQGTRIRWNAARATSCHAFGRWSNVTDTYGKHWISSIEQTTSYQMTCVGEGGSITRTITLTRDTNTNRNDTDNEAEEPQQPAPKLVLSSDLSTLKQDEGTRIRWSATNANSCRAIGGWTTKTGTIDKHWISSIEQTTSYQMTCVGEGGSITQSITLTRDTDDSSEEPQQPAPKLVLSSDLSTLKQDEGTRIRWSASNANSCRAIGGWTSKTGTIDKHWISSIEQTTSYQMTCVGEGGSITQSITLTRDTDDSSEEPGQEEPQQPAPTLSLTSDFASVDSDSSTTIRWTSNNTNSCIAENNWSSKNDVTGKQFIGSIQNTTLYTMTCTGEGGEVTKSVLVTVNSPTLNTGSVDLNWIAPTTNQDGSQLNDLAGYKIYFGASQSNLNNVIDVDAGLTNYMFENLPSGTHYFSISAVDVNGNESNRSNIAAKVVD